MLVVRKGHHTLHVIWNYVKMKNKISEGVKVRLFFNKIAKTLREKNLRNSKLKHNFAQKLKVLENFKIFNRNKLKKPK